MPQPAATVVRPPETGGERRKGSSDRALRGAAVAATAMTFLLIAIGGAVRATGSGLGCPGWPKCFDRWVPPLEYHALIEYSHRLAASVVVVLIAVFAVVAWRRHPRVRRVVWPPTLAVGVVFVQAALGGVVVEGGLAPALVTAHFATAMVLAAVLVVGTVAAFTVDATARSPDGFTSLARAAAAGSFLLLLMGAYVRGAGASLAFRDWPLMDGQAVPDLSSLGAALHFGHRVAALAVGAVVVAFAVQAWRRRHVLAPVAALAGLAACLFALQVVVGGLNVLTRLAPAAVGAHVVLAALVWGSLVAAASASRVVAPRRST